MLEKKIISSLNWTIDTEITKMFSEMEHECDCVSQFLPCFLLLEKKLKDPNYIVQYLVFGNLYKNKQEN